MFRAGVCALVLVLLSGDGLASRITQRKAAASSASQKAAVEALGKEELSSASEGVCPSAIPKFRTWKPERKVTNKCGVAAWGTMYVGLLAAHDLSGQDWFSASDPYARFRLSDKHWREMRGFWAKEKPVPVTDDLYSATKSNTSDPVWRKTFAFDFMCPQIPFGPNDAPMGPKPPIVVDHLRDQNLNQGKSGHEFQLELTLKDEDPLNVDDSLGRVKIPVLDVMNGKWNGMQSFQLTEASGVQGTVDMLVWFCAEGDAACDEDRKGAWKDNNTPDRVVKRLSFDCQMGCHTLLDPARGRLFRYVEAAKAELRQAIGSAESAERFEQMEEEYDVRGDANVLGMMEAEHKEERKKLQEEYQRHEELEEMADRKGDLAKQSREASWVKAG